ncbi:MAG: SH3 domain-containing protein [Chloroflexi bacterium]|nr:SH3 domain-containing protein [Chloroflexota bacterium]
MKRPIKIVSIALALVMVALAAAMPAAAQPPPWGDERWYVYEPIGLQAAAITLRMGIDDLSDELWAGRSLAELALEAGIPLRYLRNAVDAEYFRWEHGFNVGEMGGAFITLPIAADCRERTPDCIYRPCCEKKPTPTPPPCCGPKSDPTEPSRAFFRVVANGGLRMRYGPGTSYGIHSVAPYGAIVEATGNTERRGWVDWIEVLYNGRPLWAAGTYLERVGP